MQNGVGYDAFMNKIESASPNSARKVIDVQTSARSSRQHTESTPLVQPEDDAGGRQAMAADLSSCDPAAHAVLPGQPDGVRRVARSVVQRDRRVQGQVRRDPVATTEPVADYLLQAMGINNLTPWVCRPTS